MKDIAGNPLNLTSLNHVSFLCRSLQESINFYTNILGFIPIKRPEDLSFDGAWLYSYGIGMHLLQSEDPDKILRKTEINPKDHHISFQCENMGAVEKQMKEMGIEYKRQRVEECGIYVDQLFFHDPDGYMIEICNCDILPVIPIAGEMALLYSRLHVLPVETVATNTKVCSTVKISDKLKFGVCCFKL